MRPRRPPRAPGLALAALAVALGAAPAPAPAAPVPLPARLSTAGQRLQARVDVSAAFGPEVTRRLGNGLTNVVAVYVAVLPEQGGPPAWVTGRLVEVLFDVWEEVYLVGLREPGSTRVERRAVAGPAALVDLLGHAALDLGPLDGLPRAFRLEARVELNPVSRELLQRTRELLANPAGARPGGGSRSVLGAVASYLLRDPDPGQDAVLFRSRPFDASGVAP